MFFLFQSNSTMLQKRFIPSTCTRTRSTNLFSYTSAVYVTFFKVITGNKTTFLELRFCQFFRIPWHFVIIPVQSNLRKSIVFLPQIQEFHQHNQVMFTEEVIQILDNKWILGFKLITQMN